MTYIGSSDKTPGLFHRFKIGFDLVFLELEVQLVSFHAVYQGLDSNKVFQIRYRQDSVMESLEVSKQRFAFMLSNA